MGGSIVFTRWRQCAPQTSTRFHGPIRVHNPNGISIRSAVCTQFTAEGTYTLQWLAPLLSKLSIPTGNWTPSNTWLLGPTRVHIPYTNSIGSATFARLTIVTDRQTHRLTDKPRYSVCDNTPHLQCKLRSTAVGPKLYQRELSSF